MGIYLDNAATTRVANDVLDSMLPYLTAAYGNPGSVHSLGREAAKAVQKAREQVANFIGASPEQIVFTSGGTEANNLVFGGLKELLRSVGKRHVVVSATEHDSVIRAVESLSCDEFSVSFVMPDEYGVVHVDSVKQAIQEDTGLVSVMTVNNETGAINPSTEIGEMCKTLGILFHTDCVQAAGSVDLKAITPCCDFLSISSHKIHGPKGMGALYVKDKSTIMPMIHGGEDQEHGLRGGTENVPGIVGFGTACARYATGCTKAVKWLKSYFVYMLEVELMTEEKRIHIANTDEANISPKIASVRVDGVEAGTLVAMLDAAGVYISAGSACRSHEEQPSMTLLSMGMSPEQARQTVRVSFSEFNTVEEVKVAAEKMASCIRMLRSGGLSDGVL